MNKYRLAKIIKKTLSKNKTMANSPTTTIRSNLLYFASECAIEKDQAQNCKVMS